MSRAFTAARRGGGGTKGSNCVTPGTKDGGDCSIKTPPGPGGLRGIVYNWYPGGFCGRFFFPEQYPPVFWGLGRISVDSGVFFFPAMYTRPLLWGSRTDIWVVFITVIPFLASWYSRSPSLCSAENIGGTCRMSPTNCPSAPSTASWVTCSHSPCRVASPSASWVLVSCPSNASAR